MDNEFCNKQSNDEEVVAYVLKIFKLTGTLPTRQEMKPEMWEAMEKRYGSVENLMKCANVDVYSKQKKLLSKELKIFVLRYNRYPTPPEFKPKNGLSKLSLYLTCFQTTNLEDIFKQTKLELNQKNPAIRAEVIERIQQYCKEHQSLPTIKDLPRSLYFRVNNYFGSISNALYAAGIDPMEIKKQELCNMLYEFVEKNGRLPKVTELSGSHNLPRVQTFLKVFGCKSWEEVVAQVQAKDIEAGEAVTNIRKVRTHSPCRKKGGKKPISQEKLLHSLIQFIEKHGRLPQLRDFRGEYKEELYNLLTYYKRFECRDWLMLMQRLELRKYLPPTDDEFEESIAEPENAE